MERQTQSPATLTEAYAQSGVIFMLGGPDASCSTSREIPYAERYSTFTAVVQTPVELLQEAARDQEEREARHV